MRGPTHKHAHTHTHTASVLEPVFSELCVNLESFNPAFTACLLMVQKTIGLSDYVRRDVALKNLIQPLAGEYGMHNNQPQVRSRAALLSWGTRHQIAGCFCSCSWCRRRCC